MRARLQPAEVEAVKGAQSTLEKSNPHLAIASYHVINGQKTYIELEKILESLGYKAETGYQAHLTTYGEKARFAGS